MNRSLRRAVLERLAAVEEMAVRASSHLSARPARAHLKTIMDGWRELLIEHQPDLKGRCPVCSGWLRRRRWPCQIWMTAHEHLVGDGPEPTRSSARKSALYHGPRQVEVIPRQVGAPAAADQTGAPQRSANQTDPEGTGADGTGADGTGADQISGPSEHGSRG